MSHVTVCKRNAMLAIVGAPENIDDLENLYLQNYGATADIDVNAQWMQVFRLSGATAEHYNLAALQFLLIMGSPTTNLADAWQWFWCDNGGAIGARVSIEYISGGNCVWFPPATSCIAETNGLYEAFDFDFTNPADTWLWEVTGQASIVGGINNTKDVRVLSFNSDTDVTFQLKVTATDSVSGDSATRTQTFTQLHRDGSVAALIGYWRFDLKGLSSSNTNPAYFVGVKNSVFDSSLKGNHGTPANAQMESIPNGQVYRGLNFDGTSGIVTIPHEGQMAVGNGTYAVWFKTTAGAQTLMQVGGLEMAMTAGGQVQLTIAGQVATSTGGLNDGGWHFAVAVWGSVGLSITVDNVRTTQGAITQLDPTTDPLYIGGNAGTPDFTGEMEQASLWSVPFTDAQADILWNGNLGKELEIGPTIDTFDSDEKIYGLSDNPDFTLDITSPKDYAGAKITCTIDRGLDEHFTIHTRTVDIVTGAQSLPFTWSMANNGRNNNVRGHLAKIHISDSFGNIIAYKEYMFDVVDIWYKALRLASIQATGNIQEGMAESLANGRIDKAVFWNYNTIEMYQPCPAYVMSPKVTSGAGAGVDPAPTWPSVIHPPFIYERTLFENAVERTHLRGMKFIEYNETMSIRWMSDNITVVPETWKLFDYSTPYLAEKLTDGDMSSSVNWVEDPGCTISGGSATWDGTAGPVDCTQAISLDGTATTPEVYRVMMTVANHAGGVLQGVVATNPGALVIGADGLVPDGVYIDYISGIYEDFTEEFALRGTDFIGDVTNVTCQRCAYWYWTESVQPYPNWPVPNLPTAVNDTQHYVNGRNQVTIMIDQAKTAWNLDGMKWDGCYSTSWAAARPNSRYDVNGVETSQGRSAGEYHEDWFGTVYNDTSEDRKFMHLLNNYSQTINRPLIDGDPIEDIYGTMSQAADDDDVTLATNLQEVGTYEGDPSQDAGNPHYAQDSPRMVALLTSAKDLFTNQWMMWASITRVGKTGAMAKSRHKLDTYLATGWKFHDHYSDSDGLTQTQHQWEADSQILAQGINWDCYSSYYSQDDKYVLIQNPTSIGLNVTADKTIHWEYAVTTRVENGKNEYSINVLNLPNDTDLETSQEIPVIATNVVLTVPTNLAANLFDVYVMDADDADLVPEAIPIDGDGLSAKTYQIPDIRALVRILLRENNTPAPVFNGPEDLTAVSVWKDCSDKTTMETRFTGGVPVENDGDSVGLFDNKMNPGQQLFEADANIPTYVADSGYNGRSAINFDGSQYLRSVSDYNEFAGTDLTLYWVFESTEDEKIQSVLATIATSARLQLCADTRDVQKLVAVAQPNPAAINPVAPNTFYYMTMRLSNTIGGECESWINGVSQGTFLRTAETVESQLSMGAYNMASTFIGDIMQVVSCKALHSDEEIEVMHDWIRTYYGVA